MIENPYRTPLEARRAGRRYYLLWIALGALAVIVLFPCCIWPTLVDVWRMVFGG